MSVAGKEIAALAGCPLPQNGINGGDISHVKRGAKPRCLSAGRWKRGRPFGSPLVGAGVVFVGKFTAFVKLVPKNIIMDEGRQHRAIKFC